MDLRPISFGPKTAKEALTRPKSVQARLLCSAGPIKPSTGQQTARPIAQQHSLHGNSPTHQARCPFHPPTHACAMHATGPCYLTPLPTTLHHANAHEPRTPSCCTPASSNLLSANLSDPQHVKAASTSRQPITNNTRDSQLYCQLVSSNSPGCQHLLLLLFWEHHAPTSSSLDQQFANPPGRPMLLQLGTSAPTNVSYNTPLPADHVHLLASHAWPTLAGILSFFPMFQSRHVNPVACRHATWSAASPFTLAHACSCQSYAIQRLLAM